MIDWVVYLEQLQVIIKEFYSITIYNKDFLI